MQGAGLDTSNVDQTDIIARAVQTNAAIYAKNLNVIAGTNQVNHDTLAATQIDGDGPAPAVAIDVAQLGGMYANRVFLVGNSAGVGVANAGTIAAQAGDLTLQSDGRLVLAGKTTASGNLAMSASGGIQNSGTTYAQQSLSANTVADLTNSGTLAAQQNTTANAGSVNSTGTLGAGVNNDGSVAHSGDLNLTASGQLTATGQNVAGGNASLTGGSVNLAGSQTATNGNLSLNATAGDVNLSNATTSAQGAIQANASGTVINDHGSLSSGGGTTLTGGNLSNQSGKVSSQGPLSVNVAGQIANQSGELVSESTADVRGGAIANNQGTIQSAGHASVDGTTIDNTDGRITSLNGDGLTLSATGQLTNAAGTTANGAQGGVIGGNGYVSVQGANVVNRGAITSNTNLRVAGQSVDNGSGTLQAAQNVVVDAGAHLANSGGSIVGQTATLSATTLDNSAGTVQADQVLLNATDVVNHGGTITQTGAGAMAVNVSGTLDNSSSGTLQTNSTDLTLAPATLKNDGGTITHAGTGTLTLGNGTGTVSNVGGSIASNGRVVAQNGTLNNASGSISAQNGLAATVAGTLNNASGKLLSNTDVSVTSGTLANDSGQIGASTNATIRTGSMTNQGGSIVAPNLSVTADSTLDNSGGKLEANQLALTAANLVNHGGTITQYGSSAMGMNVSGTLDNSAAGVIQTNSTDLTLTPAELNNAGGTITHAGAGTLTIAPGNGASALNNAAGTIVTKGQAIVNAATWNNASGQGGTLAAKGNVTLGAASATSTVNSNSSGSDSHGSYAETLHTSDQALTGTTLKGGDTVNIVSGKDIMLSGSAISLDKGNANLLAAGDVNVGAATETHELNSHETHSHSNVVSGVKVASGIDQTMTLNRGSLVSADGVNIVSGKDVNVQGSAIVGTNDVTLTAARNVTVTTSQDTLESSSYYNKKESGLMSGGGLSVSVGSSSMKTTSQTTEVSNNASTVGSLKGNLSITAGNDLHVTGSDLIAAQNLSGTGANVTIDAAQDKNHRGETQEVSKSGLTLALKAPVIDAVSNAVGQSRASSNSQDGRAAALHGMAAASAAWDANVAAGDVVRALGAGETPQFKVEVSVGSSHSKSAFSEDSVTNRGSSVTAGGTAAFAATGNGQPGSGNVTIAGSNVNANDVILAAKNQVNIVNTTDTDSTRSTNESKSASVGVSVGTGGFGVSAAMSKANGDGNSDLATQNNSHVNAANNVTIISGGDTNIIGSNVKGNQVNADVGGNLNIVSVQDTLTSAAHQSSSGGGFGVSQGGASASFSQSKGNASGSYAGVNEQAGIHAGDGGFNINVTGNTDLKGGLIASDADASKNSLTTGSLSFSDIQNQSHYDASSSGFSAGATTGDGGMNYSTHGSTSGKNTGGAAPMLGQNDSGSDSATTKSGVSAGTVTITDSANQKQDVASLNRDTTNTNGTVAKLPDMQNLLANQSDMMAAASAAGEAVSRRIGDYADEMKRQAEKNGDQAGVDAWKEGGANRALMQGAGAALVTGLAGGNAVGGAAGAAIASIASGKLNELSSAIAGSDPTGNANMNQALGNIVANALATGAGGVVGGESGAFSGYNVDRFNRQLHEDSKAKELTLAKKLATESGGKYTVEQIVDQMAQMNLVTSNGGMLPGNVQVASGDKPQDGTDWTQYGVNRAGQTVWTQSLGPGDPDLQAYIAKGAQGSGFSYQATTTGSNPGLVRAPDFVNFQVDYFVGSVWGTFTRDGNSFFGGGLNMGVPNPVGAGASISVGYLNTNTVRPGQTNNFAGGYAGGGSALYGGMGGGIMVSPGNGTATVVGFGAGVNVGKTNNPASVGWGFSVDQGKTGIRW
ncbi:tRNA nuclease CdiA-2 [Burkholderia gladioli]|nr:tRNA nuclease CdiA-2 [Burkholderia gladioli]